MKAVIVDDEPNAIKTLRFLLSENCKNVDISGEAESVPTAVDTIRRKKPDLVFLDLDLSGRLGFEVLETLGLLDFEVIYTTAYDRFWQEAWHRYNGVDYLLKPIKSADLVRAVGKAEALVRKRQLAQAGRLKKWQKQMSLLVPHRSEHDLVPLHKILYCQADQSYANFHLKSGKIITATRPLAHFESELQPYGFLRIHKSLLVNTAHIEKYKPGKRGGAVQLLTGEDLEIGETHLSDFQEWLRANHLGTGR
jgi:two-component system, LytTR family, response regulator